MGLSLGRRDNIIEYLLKTFIVSNQAVVSVLFCALVESTNMQALQPTWRSPEGKISSIGNWKSGHKLRTNLDLQSPCVVCRDLG